MEAGRLAPSSASERPRLSRARQSLSRVRKHRAPCPFGSSQAFRHISPIKSAICPGRHPLSPPKNISSEFAVYFARTRTLELCPTPLTPHPIPPHVRTTSAIRRIPKVQYFKYIQSMSRKETHPTPLPFCCTTLKTKGLSREKSVSAPLPKRTLKSEISETAAFPSRRQLNPRTC